MIKNYLTIAFRNLRRNKVFSIINILGLAIGISASLVIFLLVTFEFGFDRYHGDTDRKFRVVSNFKFSGDVVHNSGVTEALVGAIRQKVTGVEAAVPFHMPNFDVKVSVPAGANMKEAVFKRQQNIVFADAAYFGFFSYHWLAGSPQASLREPYCVVLTESRAKSYFNNLGYADMVGRMLDYNDSVHVKVTGIVRDPGKQTDFDFQEFISQSTLTATSWKTDYYGVDWGNTSSNSQLYVKTAKGITPSGVERQLNALLHQYNTDQKWDSQNEASFQLQPLEDVHFNSFYENYGGHQAHKPTLYGLIILAIFLLLLGCINFINLTTAQATQRAKEIGVRKTMGSTRNQLILQFLSETFLLTLMATFLSIAVTPLLLKVFADFMPAGIHTDYLHQPQVILMLLLLTLVVSVFSGFYPAMVLSGYKPAHVLKGQFFTVPRRFSNLGLRKTLTVFQFVIAQFFIMATFIVGNQIHFNLTKDLGFKKDAVVFFQLPYSDTLVLHRTQLVNRLKSLAGIASVSLSNYPPISGGSWSSTMIYRDGKKEKESSVQIKYADTAFVGLYKMKILAGANLTSSDTPREVLINETYAHILGFQDPGQAIGKYIEWNNRHEIITGVLSDFHLNSLRQPIKPMVLASQLRQELTINVSLLPENREGTGWTGTIGQIKKAFGETYPDETFEYNFLDDSIAKFYKSEQDISRLLKWATALALFISSLGLLGLVIYTTNQRVKEIGVRKVLGASSVQIVSLLSVDFVILVVVAFAIACPLAWWSGHKWQDNFAYKVPLGWWLFGASGLLMLLAALVSISLQTLRAATANPVKSLRSE